MLQAAGVSVKMSVKCASDGVGETLQDHLHALFHANPASALIPQLQHSEQSLPQSAHTHHDGRAVCPAAERTDDDATLHPRLLCPQQP